MITTSAKLNIYGGGMIISILTIHVHPSRRADAVKTIKAVMGPIQVKPGCLKFMLNSHVDNDDILVLLEQWSSQEDFEQHVQSEEYRLILAAMELSTRQPEIEIHTVSSTVGLDFVERLRGGAR